MWKICCGELQNLANRSVQLRKICSRKTVVPTFLVIQHALQCNHQTIFRPNVSSLQPTGWPLSSHDQIPWIFTIFQVITYGALTLATAAIKTKCTLFHDIFMTTMSFNILQWDNLCLYRCKTNLYLVNNSFCAHFVSRSILMVIDHMQEHTFPDFYFFPLTFPWPLLNSLTFPGFPGSPGEWPPCLFLPSVQPSHETADYRWVGRQPPAK